MTNIKMAMHAAINGANTGSMGRNMDMVRIKVLMKNHRT